MNTPETVKIRPYAGRDRENVRGICLATAGEPMRAMQDFLYATFCDYYIESEPQNCFVAADENDAAIGYILCAENAAVWFERFCGEYIPRLAPPFQTFARDTATSLLSFADKYPAHLHIDILPGYQGMRVGQRLMDTLTAHLRGNGVPGLMLSVAGSNTGAQRFYQRYGFCVLAEDEHAIAMGLSLAISG